MSFLLLHSLFSLMYMFAVIKCQLMQVITGPSEITISCEVNHTQSLNHKRFDILVSRIQGNESQSFNSSFENVLEKFSRRGLSIENAVSTDSIFHYFEAIDIMNPGSYRISVRPSDGQSGDSMRRYFLRVRNTKAEDACPILLQQDPPLSYGTEGTRIRKLSSRIVGGNIASRNLVQYMAAIFMKSGSVCTGTLISSRWVLTAAHCNTTTESIVFILSTRLTRNGVRVGVSRVFSHPKYRMAENKVDYDIAVVELAVDVEQYGIKGMELNLNESIPTENYFVRTAGYGRTSFQRQNDTGTRTMARLELRQVDVPVTNFEYCKKRYNKFFREPSQMTKEHMFCLGYVGEGGCDTCQGDSGGPVIEYAGQKPVVVGIVSSGVECALPDYPGVNIRLAGMKEWLETTPAGYVVNTEEINEVIIRCSAGEYLKSEGVEPARCVKCEEGSVSKGGTSHICTTPKDDYEANGI